MSDQRQNPILALTMARLKEFTRQREAVFWVYFFPILMMAILGIAFRSQPVEQIAVSIIESSHASEIAERLASDERILATVVSEEEARRQLRTGKCSLVVSCPTSDLNNVQYMFDPTRPGSAMARNAIDNQIQIAAGRKDVVSTADVEFSEPGGRYIDFLVPGLLGMSLMGGGLWGVGFAIVDMRIKKLLKRLMATPMKRSHFLMGVMGSRLIYMVPQVIFLLVFARWIFGVQIFGSYAAIVFLIFIGAIEFAVIGLLVAARAKTLEAASGLMNLVMLPLYMFCGIFFSYERFPDIAQTVIKWLPLTPVIDALRAVMLDGKSLTTQGPEILAITLWTIVPFFVAMLIFRWKD